MISFENKNPNHWGNGLGSRKVEDLAEKHDGPVTIGPIRLASRANEQQAYSHEQANEHRSAVMAFCFHGIDETAG